MQFEEIILGETWTIAIVPTSADKRLNDCDGFCDKTSRRILVDDFSMCDDYDLDDRVVHIRQNLRHEIVHAFMFESGLQANWQHPEYGHEETVVDWIAVQWPKLRKVIEDAEKRFVAGKREDVKPIERDNKYAGWAKSDKACPTCGDTMIYNPIVILTSFPAQRELLCPSCGHTEYEMIGGSVNPHTITCSNGGGNERAD